jgi:hypothetical protein
VLRGQALLLFIGVIFGMLAFIAASLIMSTPAYSLTGLQSINVQVVNKTYSLYYSFSNDGSVIEAKADSMQPYGGELYASIKSPTNGYMDIVISRELYDVIGFTDHPNLTVFVDDNVIDANILDNMTSCDQISFRIPIRANSESIDVATGDILSVHSHSYPPKLPITKNISVEGQQFQLPIFTHAARCDISFSIEEKKLHIDIDGRAGENDTGFFSISVPPRLLSGNLTVMVDGKPPNNLQIYKPLLLGLHGEDPNNATISFNYSSGAKSIDIMGTSAVPEFSSLSSLAIMAEITGIIIMAAKVRAWKG